MAEASTEIGAGPDAGEAAAGPATGSPKANAAKSPGGRRHPMVRPQIRPGHLIHCRKRDMPCRKSSCRAREAVWLAWIFRLQRKAQGLCRLL